MKHRTWYYIAGLLIPFMATVLELALLRPEIYTPELPEFMRIGAPIFLGVVASAYLLKRLPKDPPR